MQEGLVYLIRAEGTDLYKIGFTTRSPEDRRASLQTGNPYPLKVITSWAATFEEERKIHSLLTAFRREGEWFELTIGGLLTLLCTYDAMLQGDSHPSQQDIKGRILGDIRAHYLEHGPDSHTIEVSPSTENLLLSSVISEKYELWRWYDPEDFYGMMPFGPDEKVGQELCIQVCIEEGYIEERSGQYRINPAMDSSGFDFFFQFYI